MTIAPIGGGEPRAGSNEMSGSITPYEQMDNEARKIARAAVQHIAGLQGRLVADIIEIGKALIGVKDAVGHGNFTPWLRVEFNWTERTAQNFMSAAERFGSNPKCVSHLPLNTVYKLAAPSTPEPLRQNIVERLERGERIDPGEISGEIRSALREAKEEVAKQKKTPEQRRREQVADARRKAAFEKNQKEYQERRAREVAIRSEACDVIARALGPKGVRELLELLKGEYISSADLSAAEDRLTA